MNRVIDNQTPVHLKASNELCQVTIRRRYISKPAMIYVSDNQTPEYLKASNEYASDNQTHVHPKASNE